ncbi:hypothetical protein P8C59_006370 [Phyllachora maydis]|uniref:Uncharacterized protein n=1 Tax=Phyllachora maydis TaxID=1825666 RepID=A0AAD9I665_9PEZI|nr:hypothetical protein P8C59_006370 [Phyllachora maydis]
MGELAEGAAGLTLSDASMACFRMFNSYPWMHDREFFRALDATVGPLTPSSEGWEAKTVSIVVQSRIWYFQAKRAIDVDRASYDRFAAQDAAAARLDRALLDRLVQVQERMRAMTDPDVPAWQARAPTVDVSRKADDDHEAEGHDGVAARTTPGHGADEAPYPLGFQQVMEAVTSGQPVPGVRDIPNSIVRAPGISPVGKMQPPRKPWQKQQSHVGDASSGLASTTLDAEFPRLDDDDDDDDDV